MCYRSSRKLIHGKHKFSKTASTQYYAWGKLTPQFPQMVVTFYVWLRFTHKPLTQLQTPNSSHLITSPRPPLAPKPLVIPHIWLLVWRTCFYTHISDAHQPQKNILKPFVHSWYIYWPPRAWNCPGCWRYSWKQQICVKTSHVLGTTPSLGYGEGNKNTMSSPSARHQGLYTSELIKNHSTLMRTCYYSA